MGNSFFYCFLYTPKKGYKKIDKCVLTLGGSQRCIDSIRRSSHKNVEKRSHQSPLVYPQNPRDTESWQWARYEITHRTMHHGYNDEQKLWHRATSRFVRSLLTVRSLDLRWIYRWVERRGSDDLGKEDGTRSPDLMMSETSSPSSDGLRGMIPSHCARSRSDRNTSFLIGWKELIRRTVLSHYETRLSEKISRLKNVVVECEWKVTCGLARFQSSPSFTLAFLLFLLWQRQFFYPSFNY